MGPLVFIPPCDITHRTFSAAQRGRVMTQHSSWEVREGKVRLIWVSAGSWRPPAERKRRWHPWKILALLKRRGTGQRDKAAEANCWDVINAPHNYSEKIEQLSGCCASWIKFFSLPCKPGASLIFVTLHLPKEDGVSGGVLLPHNRRESNHFLQ